MTGPSVHTHPSREFNICRTNAPHPSPLNECKISQPGIFTPPPPFLAHWAPTFQPLPRYSTHAANITSHTTPRCTVLYVSERVKKVAWNEWPSVNLEALFRDAVPRAVMPSIMACLHREHVCGSFFLFSFLVSIMMAS